MNAMTHRTIALLPLLLAVLPGLAACGGKGLIVSRGITVPMQLQHMTGDELHEYFMSTGQKAYTDGSVLEASVVMVDLSYLKSTGQLLEATGEEMQALGKLKRFEVQLEYETRTVFAGATETEGIAFEKWAVTLRDSAGTVIEPTTESFDAPLVQKAAITPEEAFSDEPAQLVMTYILRGHLIFDYQVPEECSWVELEFAPPQTGHNVSVRWEIAD